MPAAQSGDEPKRILALDGGGVRGVVTIAFLERMEAQLRAELRKPNLVLADHFDLIGGTSVGSIIATMLALGWPMEKVTRTFKEWGPAIFSRLVAFGYLRSKFDATVLEEKLQESLKDMRLADPALKTRLAIITKRLDTGSPWWIVTNNPNSEWWNGDGAGRQNHAFRLTDLVRASTAAPTVFKPKLLPIEQNSSPGVFVDGGVSPFNNPSLALLMTARLKGHGFHWPLGSDKLQMISIGTGSWREPIRYGFWQRNVAALLGVQALRGLIADNQMLSLALLQWMSHSRLPIRINGEIGDLSDDLLGFGSGPHTPLLKFQRYDLPLEAATLAPMMKKGKPPSARALQRFRRLDHPGEMESLYQFAQKVAAEQVHVADFL